MRAFAKRKVIAEVERREETNGLSVSAKVAAAGAFLLTVGAFAGAVTGGHLHLDDWGYTYGCAFVKDGLGAGNLLRAFSDVGNGGIWMPLTYITYMADVSLLGGGWFVHHGVNVFLHGINAALAFLFIMMAAKRIVGGEREHLVWPCLLGALLWSLHPMRAEAVAWVASRKEELWTLFALLAGFAWVAYLERGGAVRYIASLGMFCLSCLAKPTAVCFPLLALLMHMSFVPERRMRVRQYAPLFLVSLFVGAIAVVSQTNPTGMARVDIGDTTVGWRLLNAAVSMGLYIAHTFVPAGIHMDYRAAFNGWPLDGALGLSVLVAATAGAVVAARMVRNRPERRLPLFLCGWFAIALLPVLGLLGVTGDKAYADRYTYLPAIAVSLAVAVVLSRIRARGARFAAAAFAVASLAAETAVLLPVVRSFSTDALAYSRVLRYDPDHWRALRVVGCELCARQNRMDEGIAMMKRSLSLRPSQQTADVLAYSLACRGADGDFEEVKRLGRAVADDAALDRGGMMLDALGIAAMREGDDAQAVKCFSAALVAPRRTHSNVHSMLNLGLALANTGRRAEALRVLQKLRGVANDKVRNRAADAVARLSAGETVRFGWE